MFCLVIHLLYLELQVEGRIAIRFDSGRDEENWKLTIGCNLPGKWVLHWGVHYAGDSGRFDMFN